MLTNYTDYSLRVLTFPIIGEMSPGELSGYKTDCRETYLILGAKLSQGKSHTGQQIVGSNMEKRHADLPAVMIEVTDPERYQHQRSSETDTD